MWKLVPLSGGEDLYLLPGKEYVVGRKNCEILLGNDQSISRAHAQLSLSNQTLTLKDTSKYGTFVNDAQLASGTVQTLKSGDRLTFGVYQSKFRVEVENLKVCSSCLENERKAELSQALSSLGGQLVSSWDQKCTHLVMPSVKVTIKTICALLCGRPIVKPEFFSVFSTALRDKKNPPQPQSYYPEIDEPSLSKEEVDLNSRPERQKLFAGKTFIFLSSKQMKRLSQAVTYGGGRSQLLEEGSVPVSLLESPGSCVIDIATGSSQTLTSASSRKWIDAVGQVLHRRGLRWITESEIGLAAIYVNNSAYCNPCSPTETESVRMKPTIPGPSLSQSVAVDETVLPAASQNITAYAINTEPSQGISCPKVSEVTSVGETPEKQPSRPWPALRPAGTATSSSISSTSLVHKPAVSRDVPSSCTTVTETMMTPLSAAQTSQSEKTKKAETSYLNKRPSGRDGDSVKFRTPQGASNKTSPQKQASLTNFFLPVNKKRPRNGSEETSQSESKLFRLESEEDELSKKDNTPSATVHTPNVKATHTLTHTHTHSTTTATTAAQNQHRTGPGLAADSNPARSSGLAAGFSASPSLGLGPGLGSGLGLGSSKGILEGLSSEFTPLQDGRKRKEMDQDEPAEPDLDLSLEELESIMDDDMDMPPEPTANKKQRLDQEEQSSVNRTAQQNQKENGDSRWSSETPKQNIKNQQSQWATSANQKLLPGQDKKDSTYPKQRAEPEEDVKEEEVSFVVSKPNVHTSPDEHKPVKSSLIKEEQKDVKPAVFSDPELPRGLLLVEFKSLVVSSGPSRTRPEPQQYHNTNHKNFKRFRKVPVPGSQGLPLIIGGSDLVAHSRGKNTELEEWLREAAEVEKQHEIEQSVGDELFRYNPKPSGKRFGKF